MKPRANENLDFKGQMQSLISYNKQQRQEKFSEEIKKLNDSILEELNRKNELAIIIDPKLNNIGKVIFIKTHSYLLLERNLKKMEEILKSAENKVFFLFPLPYSYIIIYFKQEIIENYYLSINK